MTCRGSSCACYDTPIGLSQVNPGEERDRCPLVPLSFLGAPVHRGFHQGLGDDTHCLLCPPSMEATKPQERKRPVLRSRSGCGWRAVPYLAHCLIVFMTGLLVLY